MLEGNSFVAIIPARGGSKGIPRKNIIPLLGRPLIYYTIKAAQDSGIFDDIYVSTDSSQIAEVASLYGAKIIERPIELAQDDTPTEPVIAHALTEIDDYHYVALLQCTNPLIMGKDILGAAKQLLRQNAEVIISVCKSKIHWVGPLGKNNSLRGFYPTHLRSKPRQEVKDCYQLNGGLYIGLWEVFSEQKDFYKVDSVAYIMHPDSFIDLNVGEDLIEAEKLLKRREWAMRSLGL